MLDIEKKLVDEAFSNFRKRGLIKISKGKHYSIKHAVRKYEISQRGKKIFNVAVKLYNKRSTKL